MEQPSYEEMLMANKLSSVLLQLALNWTEEDTNFYRKAYKAFNYYYESNAKLLQKHLDECIEDEEEYKDKSFSEIIERISFIFALSIIKRAVLIEEDNLEYNACVFSIIAVLASYKDLYEASEEE